MGAVAVERLKRLLELNQKERFLAQQRLNQLESARLRLEKRLEDEVNAPPPNGVDLIDRLPDEMLAKVLCNLPVSVLFGTATKVCRRWQSVIRSIPEAGFTGLSVEIRLKQHSKKRSEQSATQRHIIGHCKAVINAMAQSEIDGNIYTALVNRQVQVWSHACELKQVLIGHTDEVLCLACPDLRSLQPDDNTSTSGPVVFSGSCDGTIRAWGAKGDCLITRDVEGGWIVSLAFSSALNGSAMLYSGSEDGSIVAWSCRDTSLIYSHTVKSGHFDTIWDIVLSPGGVQLYAATADTCISVWPTEYCSGAQTMNPIATLKGHTDEVLSLALSPYGGLYSGSCDETIRYWEKERISIRDASSEVTYHTARWRLVETWQAQQGEVRALTTSGGQLFSGGDDGSIRMWTREQNRGNHKNKVNLGAHSGPIRALSMREGCLLSGSYDSTICAW